MKKLWEKNISLNSIAERYCSSKNVVQDNILAPYDVYGSIAHVKMLYSIGLIDQKEFHLLHKHLTKILKEIENKQFIVQIGDEDIHTKVEGYLTEVLGDIGKKIHTARSRNDQINLDLKLYSKDFLTKTALETFELVKVFYNYAKKYEFTLMPGYTHMQRAMPSSIGLWAGSFVESLLDDVVLLHSAFKHNDKSPLGSGAAYGVSLPIDREYTTELLGFKKVQNNSLYAQVSRCKDQAIVIHALSQIMLTLSRFAEDMVLFTTSEYQFFEVDEELCTGSSIMPQKKNLDIMEVLRGRAQIVLQYQQVNSSILAGLPSGYNTDFGETKNALLSSFEITRQSLEITRILLSHTRPIETNMKKMVSKDMYATHAAYELVKQGVPFRDAYLKVGLSLDSLKDYDPDKVLRETNHSGGPGNLKLENVKREMMKVRMLWMALSNSWQETLKKLIKE